MKVSSWYWIVHDRTLSGFDFSCMFVDSGERESFCLASKWCSVALLCGVWGVSLMVFVSCLVFITLYFGSFLCRLFVMVLWARCLLFRENEMTLALNSAVVCAYRFFHVSGVFFECFLRVDIAA